MYLGMRFSFRPSGPGRSLAAHCKRSLRIIPLTCDPCETCVNNLMACGGPENICKISKTLAEIQYKMAF